MTAQPGHSLPASAVLAAFAVSCSPPPRLGNPVAAPERVFVRATATPDTGPLIAALREEIPEHLTVLAEGSAWLQDSGEFVWQQHADLWTSARQRALPGVQDALRRIAEGVGEIVTLDAGGGAPFDEFGNLEASPPLPGYPLGRVLRGLGRGVLAERPALTERLHAQAPLGVDTSWLCVGHVDEVVAFVPDPSARLGFRVVLADPRAGVDVIEGLHDGPLPRYPAPRFPGAGAGSRDGLLRRGTLRTFADQVAGPGMDRVEATLRDGLDLRDGDIVRWPVPFVEALTPDGPCGASSLVPNPLNHLLLSGVIVLGEPGLAATPAGDPIAQAVLRTLPPSLRARWVDADDLHRHGGSVHCATLSLRPAARGSARAAPPIPPQAPERSTADLGPFLPRPMVSGPADPATAQAIAILDSAETDGARAAAVAELATMPAAGRALAALYSAEPSREVRGAILLGAFTRDHPEDTALIAAALRDPAASVRALALRAASGRRDLEAAVTALPPDPEPANTAFRRDRLAQDAPGAPAR